VLSSLSTVCRGGGRAHPAAEKQCSWNMKGLLLPYFCHVTARLFLLHDMVTLNQLGRRIIGSPKVRGTLPASWSALTNLTYMCALHHVK
jgi:hypothetical protein